MSVETRVDLLLRDPTDLVARLCVPGPPQTVAELYQVIDLVGVLTHKKVGEPSSDRRLAELFQ